MLTPRENPLYRKIFSSEEDQTHDAASGRTVNPTHYQRAIATHKQEHQGYRRSCLSERQRRSKIRSCLYIKTSIAKAEILTFDMTMKPCGQEVLFVGC